MRILVAGVIGGLAMFAWTSIAHMTLPWANLESENT